MTKPSLDSNPMLTKEGREVELKRMHLCTDLAMALLGHMIDGRTVVARSSEDTTEELVLTSDDAIKIIATFPDIPKLADWRLGEIGQDVLRTVREFNISPCGVSWLAHMLQHDIYDPNLRRH